MYAVDCSAVSVSYEQEPSGQYEATHQLYLTDTGEWQRSVILYIYYSDI